MTIALDPFSTIVFVIVMVCCFVFAGIFIFRKKPEAGNEKKTIATSIIGVALQGLAMSMPEAYRR